MDLNDQTEGYPYRQTRSPNMTGKQIQPFSGLAIRRQQAKVVDIFIWLLSKQKNTCRIGGPTLELLENLAAVGLFAAKKPFLLLKIAQTFLIYHQKIAGAYLSKDTSFWYMWFIPGHQHTFLESCGCQDAGRYKISTLAYQ